MPPLAQKQHAEPYLTNRIKRTLETSRVLLNAVQIDAAQDSKIFSQFYLCANLHKYKFYKIKYSFSKKKKTRYEVLLE